MLTTSGNEVETSPKCGAASKMVTLSFRARGTTQEHMTYTKKTYDLSAQAGSAHPPRWSGKRLTRRPVLETELHIKLYERRGAALGPRAFFS
jgi:hypothetical protein